MKYVLTAQQMKAADMWTIEQVGIPSPVLMERAALSCVKVMEEQRLDLSNVLIVCGFGNNGGDGCAVARLLREKGYRPEVVFAGKPESKSREMSRQMGILENLGVSPGNCLPDREYSVIIDAVFGIGLTRPVEGKYREIIEKMNGMKAVKVAVDIPSGISADTGEVLGTAFRADLTVTFAYRKQGQVFYPGCSLCGKIFVMPIGIEDSSLSVNKEAFFTLEREDVYSMLPTRPADSNKGTFGKVLLIAGSRGMSGAAYLSAGAAYASGAGMVRIYTEESNRVILQQLLPEAVITTYEEDGAESIEKLESLMEWADVIGIGSGLGRGTQAVRLVETVLEKYGRPCVLDADALNILADRDGRKELLRRTNARCILTPHMKEMSRLTGRSVEELKTHRTRMLSVFTEEYPVVCVMKDTRTIVSEKGRQMYLNTSGDASLAKGGTGDVLAGMIAGFLAQKLSGYEAAVLGVCIHGWAGEQAGREKGSRSVLARDITDGIGKTLQILEEQHEELQQSACSH